MTVGQTQIAAAYADAAKPLDERIAWTEVGASTTDGWSEDKQGGKLSYQYYLMDTNSQTLPLASRTDAMVIHETVENPSPSYGNTWQTGYGFTKVKNGSAQFVLKKAYCTFRTLFGGFSSCPTSLP
jgi:hypothetical protein